MSDTNDKNLKETDDLFSSLDLSEATSFTKQEEPKTAERRTERKKTRELNTAAQTVDRQTLKAEKATKKKSKVKKIIFWSVLEVVTLAAIFIYGYFLRSWNLITRPEVNENVIENHNLSAEKIAQMEQGYWTFAVFGVDGRNASDLVSKGLNSDVVLIVSINQDTGEIRMCSVFRDTYLNISDNNRYRKINQAYSEGGPEQALAALNKNLDLNIKNYVTFNWKAVADGINILGGIDGIDISKAELYYINAFITETVNVTKIGSYQLKSTGVQHLDGVQAVAYGRLRLMDNDYARTERQKKVIKAAFDKAKQSSFSVLNNIMVVCFPEVATNINFNTVVAMAQNITKYYISESGGFPWQRSESSAGSLGDVVVPATLESNVKYLHEFLFGDVDYQPSQAVLSYSNTIKEKTGIYKEGQVVESVRTDGGLISTPKKTEAATEKKAEKTGEDDEDEPETDENGETIQETDEDGNPVTKATDEEDELDPEGRPNALNTDGAANPGEVSHGDDEPEENPGAVGPGRTDGPGGGNRDNDNESSAPGWTKTDENNDRPNAIVIPGNNDGPGPGSSSTEKTTEGTNSLNPEGGPGSSSSSENSGSDATGPGASNVTPGNTDGPSGGTSSGSNVSEGGPGSSSSSSGNTNSSPEGPGSSSSSGTDNTSAGPGGQISAGSTDGPGGGSTPGDAPIG